MPLQMTHLAVAYKIAGAYKRLYESNEYFLGAISPDAVSIRTMVTRPDRRKSHMGKTHRSSTPILPPDYTIGQEEFIEIADVFRENVLLNKPYSNFLCGYSVHILTDMYWAIGYGGRFERSIGEHVTPYNDVTEISKLYYSDTGLNDVEQYERYEWTSLVFSRILNATAFGILDSITPEEVVAWRNRIFNSYSLINQRANNKQFLTTEGVDEFISETAANICGLLKDR